MPTKSKLPYTKALKYAKAARCALGIPKAVIVGSIRRENPIIGDIDLLTTHTLTGVKLTKNAIAAGWQFKKIRQGLNLISGRITSPANETMPIDIFKTSSSHTIFAAALFHYTGSKQYNIRVRKLAKLRGYKLNQYGLFKTGKLKSIPLNNEYDIMRILGITLRTPNDRQN